VRTGSAAPAKRSPGGGYAASTTTPRTLAPSTITATGLLGRGIGNVWLWGRGVDTTRFDPARRSEEIRARLAPGGELIVGYVGRLATEKRVELLAGITTLPQPRLVIVGAGPAEGMLRQHMPTAGRVGLPDRPRSRPGAVQPAAHAPGGVRLDGHQGHRLAGPAVDRPGTGARGPGHARVAGR
jgi:hypothetical protein